MTVLEELQAAPDGVFYNRAAVIEYIRRAQSESEGADRLLSPRQAGRVLGWSKSQWTRWAPEIEGAFRDEAGRWRLPLSGCRAHIADIAKRGAVRRSVLRGPQKRKATRPAA